ncbi:olfactomedin-4-like [Ictalurus furcatus]|uniref:olfactomedin-4-like n=1 Tax=Ictalurus furcatus TaxID=66913 RepID=UPI0023508C62|nr:olfactomedin-4-like [Ictalurus furcatus]
MKFAGGVQKLSLKPKATEDDGDLDIQSSKIFSYSDSASTDLQDSVSKLIHISGLRMPLKREIRLKDPKPAPGKEDMYWLVALTSSDVYANYVQHYSSLSTLLAGVGYVDTVIVSSNPTTNTIMGPNVVQHGDALYYGCYSTPSVCRFNISTCSVTNTPLPQNSGYNNKFPFGHLDATYKYTDLDFATDESGVWVVYTAQDNFGNVILSEVIEGSPPSLGRTWRTSLHKRTATNTFMACGVLYATRFLDQQTEEIFYSFDTETSEERYDLKIRITKMQTNIQSLNYNPRDRMLYAYSDSYIVSYDTVFE